MTEPIEVQPEELAAREILDHLDYLSGENCSDADEVLERIISQYTRFQGKTAKALGEELAKLKDLNQMHLARLNKTQILVGNIYQVTGCIDGGDELESAKKLQAERDAAVAALEKARAVLSEHHEHHQQECLVFFSQDGKPIELSTDLGEAYADSGLAEKTAKVLSELPSLSLAEYRRAVLAASFVRRLANTKTVGGGK